MADLSYNVKVNTGDAQRSLNGLKSALGGLAAAFGIREIVQFADGVANLQNKLRTISKDTGDVQRQFRAIAAIADSSRSSLSAVGDLYFKIARAAGDLGVSQRDAAIITDTVAKSLQLSGASAAEAASAITQLGQALGSGLLRGEELNAILESAPVLATMLAKELGVTVGELRKLGSEGKLTGDIVAAAFVRANAAVNEQFGKTLPTISQSLTKVQTAFAVMFADIESNTGVFAGLANAIISIGEAVRDVSVFYKENSELINGIVKSLALLGGAFLIFKKVLPAVQGLTNAVYALLTAKGGLLKQVVALGGHFGRFFTHLKNVATAGGMAGSRMASLALAFSQVIKFVLRFAGVAGIIASVALAVDALLKKFFNITVIGDAVDWVIGKFKQLGKFLGIVNEETAKTTDKVKESVGALNTDTTATAANAARKKELAGEVYNLRQELIRATQDYGNQANELERSLSIQNKLIGASKLKQDIDAAQRQAESAYFAEAQRLQDALAKAKRSSSEAERAQIPLLLEQLAKLDRRYSDNLETIKKLVIEQENLVRARELEVFATEAQTRTTDELARIQREQARLGMSDIQKKYLEIADAADESAKAAIRAEEARRGESLSADEIKAYYAAATKGVGDLQRAQARLTDSSRSFSVGWRNAFNEYVDNATNAAAVAGRLFTKFVTGLEDAIVGFVKTGKFNWKQFVADMSEELLRSQIRKTIAGLGKAFGLEDLFGGPPGSSATNPMYVIDVSSGGAGGMAGGGSGGGGGGLIGAAKTAAGGIWNTIKNGVASIFGGSEAQDAKGGIWNTIKSTAASLFNGGLKGISSMMGSFGKSVSGLLSSAGSGLSSMASSLMKSVGGLFSGAKSGASSTIGKIASSVGSLFSSGKSSGGGILDSLVSGAKSLFSGFFANGGVIPAGKFGVVGERGPELITGPAGITPMGGMGGSTNVTYNIQAVDAASFQALVARDPGFIHAVAMQGARGIPSRR